MLCIISKDFIVISKLAASGTFSGLKIQKVPGGKGVGGWGGACPKTPLACARIMIKQHPLTDFLRQPNFSSR